MKKLSVGETLEILKKYSDVFVNDSGLSKYDINSLDYLEIYKFLIEEGLLPKDVDSSTVLPEMKTFSYLIWNNALLKSKGKLNKQNKEVISSASIIRFTHCLWNWSNSEIVYKFDKDIEQDLINNSDFTFNSRMPVELFDYLPHDNFFVSINEQHEQIRKLMINKSKEAFLKAIKETSSNTSSINKSLENMHLLGFFFNKDKIYKIDESKQIIGYDIHYRITVMFHTDIDENLFCPKVQIDLNIPKDKKKPLSVLDCIVGKNNSEECEECEMFITKVLPYIFYLCSENAVIQERKLSKKQIKKLYKNKSNKSLPILNVVSKPIEDDKVLSRNFPSVSAIIESEEDIESFIKKKGSAKCPHERRSHWHRFWIGKKNSDERRLILKWISSMKIRADLNRVISTEIKVKNN